MKIRSLIPFAHLPSKPVAEALGYGTIKGVLLPNILQMIGVILFLRLGWILGHVGMAEMAVIITLASSILLITGLSITAIATNMKIGAGGSYYIISRSLGIEFGSSIGILLCISQTTSVALCVSGFAVSLQELMPHIPIEVFEVSTLVALGIISYVSTNLALQTQIFIFCVLVTSIIAIFTGSSTNIPASIEPGPVTSLSFWVAFAMFFPAATGIESGMSMSGDLKNPSRSIPWGTVGAIIVAYLLYMNVAFFLSRQVSPEILCSHPLILYHLPKIGLLVVLGIWAATLSSALGGILGAPRVMQAVANDGILPKFLGRGYGKTNQPRIATIAVFFFALALTLLTDINHLIPILTMVCLVTYGFLNFVAFFEEFIQNPSWRPSFRLPWIVSLIGCLACFMMMFMINAGATFIVLATLIVIHVWSSMRRIQGNWEDIRYSLFSFIVTKALSRLQSLTAHAKHWRPHLLTFLDTATPNKRDLIAFSHALNQDKSSLSFSISLPEISKCTPTDIEFENSMRSYLEETQVSSFCHVNHNKRPLDSIIQVGENYGIGPLQPNTLILTFDEMFFSEPEMIDFLERMHSGGKNIILLKSDCEVNTSFMEPSKKSAKQLHLWWEGRSINNFKLSLALCHIIQASEVFQGANVQVNALITDEVSRPLMEKEWLTFKELIRMPSLDFSIFQEEEVDIYRYLSKYSNHADLTFLGLLPPKKDELEAYQTYLCDLAEKTRHVNKIVFVLSGDKVNFGKIFFG